MYRIVSVILYGSALCLLCIAGVMAWQYWAATTTGDVVPPSKTVTTSTETPSERTPPAIENADNYTVAANAPRALKIASLAIASFIQPVGTDQYGQIAVPSNVHFAGWYVDSSPPGTKGVTVIDGHVGGRYGGAVFSKLPEIKVGDTVLLQKGDLSWLTYQVERNVSVTPDDNAALFTHSTNSENELHLITCTGVYIPAKKSYDQRSLIIARQIDQ